MHPTLARDIFVVASFCLHFNDFARADPNDVCRDSLASGTLSTLQIQKDEYRYVVDVIRESSQSNVEQQGSLGVKVPVSDAIPVGVDKRDAKRAHHATSRTAEYSSVLRDKGSYLLQIGDATILNAWLECVKAQSASGGLAVWYEAKSNTIAVLHMQYFAPHGLRGGDDPRLTIERSVVAPKRSKNSCFDRGARLGHGRHCQLEVEAGGPTETVTTVIQTDRGDYSATLQPRMKLVRKDKLWPSAEMRADNKQREEYTARVYSEYADKAGTPKCVVPPDGWTFLESSINLIPYTYANSKASGPCTGQYSMREDGAFCFQAMQKVVLRGDHSCATEGSAKMVKYDWEPAFPQLPQRNCTR